MFKIFANKINSISFGNNQAVQTHTSTPETLKQNNEISNTTPVYGVKTPTPFTKTGTLNLPNNLKAECYKLSNGQKVVIVPKKGETTINTYVNTGSMNEPDNVRGISHYIEHNLFNGSDGLKSGEFFERVNKMGASTNASTAYATTNYYIKSNLLKDSDLEEMVKLHASMIETPHFAPEMLEKEKAIVSSEINMITQDPENVTTNKAIKNLYNIKTNSTDMIGGTCDNIAKLTKDDVVNYYNNNYYPANMTTVITGDVTPEEAMALVSKYFSSKRVPNKPQKHETLTPIQNTKREDIISDKATSTNLQIAINGPKNCDTKDKLALNCAMSALFDDVSSRVNSKISNLGCNVSDTSEKISSDKNANSVRLIGTDSTDDNVEKALNTTFNEIAKLKQQPITQDELDIVKKNMKKYYLEAFQDNFDINSNIGTALLNGNTDTLENYEKILDALTIDDVKNAVDKYLDTNKMSIVVTHPASSNVNSLKTSYENANKSVSFTGNNPQKEAIDTSKINSYVLPNRIQLTTNDSSGKVGYMRFDLKSNNLNDDYAVESHVLGNMFDKGTLKNDEVAFSKSLNKDAMNMTCGASQNGLSIFSDFYTSDTTKAFDKMKELLYSPRLTQENLDVVKKNIKDDLMTKEKSPYDKIDNELQPKSFGGIKKEEIIKKLDSLTLDDIRAFYLKLLAEGQGTMTVTGPFNDNTQFKNDVINNTSMLPQTREFKYELPQKFKSQTQTKVLTDTDNKPQAKIVEAFTFKNSENLKDNTSINLLNIILGGTPSSRLFLDLREKQKLAYRVESNVNSIDDTSMMALSIGTTTDDKESGQVKYDNLQKSINGFNNNIQKITTEKVSQEELDNAKLSLKNRILSNLQTSEDVNYKLANLKRNPYGLTYLNQELEMIDKITPDDIYNTANFIFKNKPIYSIVATEDTINSNKDYLKTLEK
ncbi:MAG: insulinase family protein [Clostridiaceae bacterium]|jgi:zinc protease|nr:insulinase family protein [Clostridiaceae bacterium]